MKTSIKYIAILMLAVGMGCSEDFLNTEPLTSLTDANFYRTKEDAEMAVVGCYAGVQEMYTGGIAFPILSEVLSDNCFGGTGTGDDKKYRIVDEFDLSVDASEQNILDGNWIQYYKALYRINVLLQKMDQINWEGDTDYRNSIEAQARFLRALIYFDMVRIWENIPLLTEPLKGNIPQADPDDVYTVIAEDLVFAANNATDEVSPGRVNQYAAKALLARVYLFYTGYYEATDLVGVVTGSQVLDGLEDVIASGEYALIQDYKNLWPAASSQPNLAGDDLVSTYAGKDNSETIFAIKYNITSDWNNNVDGNHWLVMLGLRTQSFSPYGSGWGACPVVPDLYSAYESSDDRQFSSIISFGDEGLDFDKKTQREYTGFAGKKYLPLANPDGKDYAEAQGAVSFLIGQYQDYVVMRFADVLLMAAELGSPDAQDYFDLVRDRSGASAKIASPSNIMEERRLEFALEGIRYWDLLRQGIDVAAAAIEINTTVISGEEANGDPIEVEKIILNSNVMSTRGFQMIPQNQITRSGGVLKQNEGWE